MSETRIIVPMGMLKEVVDAEAKSVVPFDQLETLSIGLRWLSENPIVPTEDQMAQIMCAHVANWEQIRSRIEAWQRRMFVAPEPEVPEEIKDLVEGMSWNSSTWRRILEAYRRGRQSAVKQ